MADASRMQINGGEKVPKYRASCDSCNEAKVRCSQTRPSCARCLKGQNRRCVYGVSKRSGKHSGEGSTKADGGGKNATVARPPATPTSTTGIETPSSSSSTIDPREFLQLFPPSSADSSDLLNGQQLQKDWTFDNNLFMPNQSATSQGSPANYDHYQFMFGRDEGHMSSVQHHGPGLFDNASDAELGSCSRDDSIAEQPPSYTQSNTQCVSCSTSNLQNDSSSMVDTCRCNEIIITQLSLLPVLLLDNECSTFDVELVQFQKAIKLCTGVLACTCPGKDYTSILTISMLIARIISFFERNGAQAGRDNDQNAPSLIMTGAMTPIRSPKFSVGIYEIEGEDECNLKREVWWMQIRKVESLVAGFKEMVAKMTLQQVYQDNSQVAAWGKLVFLLEQKAQAVKRDWSACRDKA
ncbi:hypothetical protein HO173_011623 [Letharia columbiana]|uniref:Zn(2)-C6 fungal-type domain-containing protein n=1 Tax=Letharia columbiana TaxID=112416 RepID=A0A8H6CTB3_9LECA|nr:uncharacterized protein HO173_011623 [Letharia columbiana]KAF6228776.1 hypothetical protein HO173_011623 [Letharia columbiana]